MSNQLNPVLTAAAVHLMIPVTQWTIMPGTVPTTSHQTTSMSLYSYFMCGVHTCTRYSYITVHDLQLFAMKGIEGRKNVTNINENPTRS